MGIAVRRRPRRQRRLHLGAEARLPSPRRQLSRARSRSTPTRASSPTLRPQPAARGPFVRGGHERQDHGDEPAGRRRLKPPGQRVVCNRTGANLDSGVATALLHAPRGRLGRVRDATSCGWRRSCRTCRPATWCCSTCSATSWTAWARSTASRTASRARSQPRRTPRFVYNADDPLCAAIAARVGNASVAFGRVREHGTCRRTRWPTRRCASSCSSMMEYEYRQYGQLGAYRCPSLRVCAPSARLCGRRRAPGHGRFGVRRRARCGWGCGKRRAWGRGALCNRRRRALLDRGRRRRCG